MLEPLWRQMDAFNSLQVVVRMEIDVQMGFVKHWFGDDMHYYIYINHIGKYVSMIMMI